jgi:hypothetical protein
MSDPDRKERLRARIRSEPRRSATMSPTSIAAAAPRGRRPRLARLPGVESASVNFATRRAEVVTGPEFRRRCHRSGDGGGRLPGDGAHDHGTGGASFDIDGLHCGILRGAGRGGASGDARRPDGAREPRDPAAEIIGTPGRGSTRSPATWRRGLPGARARNPGRRPRPPPVSPDETAPYRRSFLIAALLTLPVFVAEWAGICAGLPSLAAPDRGTDTPAPGAIRF